MTQHNIIAEIGTSHSGSLKKAKELIDVSVESGASTAKFQWVIAEEIVSPLAGEIILPSGSVNIHNSFKNVEKDLHFYADIKDYCNKKNINFLCSIFGPKSLSYLLEIGATHIKIASPEINYLSLLQQINDVSEHRNISVMLSDGISSYIDIFRAVNSLHFPVELLHCITQYPAQIQQYHVPKLSYYKDLFACKVGISDHTSHPYLLAVLAMFFGSETTEKHITLDKNSRGLDDSYALSPKEFSIMSAAILHVQKNLLSQKDPYEIQNILSHSSKDANIEEKLLQVKYQKIHQYIQELETMFPVLDSTSVHKKHKKKDIDVTKSKIWESFSPNGHSACFLPIYFTTRRSLICTKKIKAGQIIDESNSAYLRSETNLLHGIAAEFFERIQGKVAKHTIYPSQAITWNEFEIINSPEIPLA